MHMLLADVACLLMVHDVAQAKVLRVIEMWLKSALLAADVVQRLQRLIEGKPPPAAAPASAPLVAAAPVASAAPFTAPGTCFAYVRLVVRLTCPIVATTAAMAPMSALLGASAPAPAANAAVLTALKGLSIEQIAQLATQPALLQQLGVDMGTLLQIVMPQMPGTSAPTPAAPPMPTMPTMPTMPAMPTVVPPPVAVPPPMTMPVPVSAPPPMPTARVPSPMRPVASAETTPQAEDDLDVDFDEEDDDQRLLRLQRRRQEEERKRKLEEEQSRQAPVAAPVPQANIPTTTAATPGSSTAPIASTMVTAMAPLGAPRVEPPKAPAFQPLPSWSSTPSSAQPLGGAAPLFDGPALPGQEPQLQKGASMLPCP